MQIELIDLRTVGTDGKGRLSFLESGRDIPFDVKRVYYTYDVPSGTKRGGHAHRELNQVLICPYGSIEIVLDNGETRSSVLLDDPAKGLVVGKMIWHDMIWRQEGSVLVVGASDYYCEPDYIRDYSEFKEEVRLNGSSAVR